MRTTEMKRSGLRVLAALAVVAIPATAIAHTVMMTPVPRDVGVAGNDAHKTGPCGAVPRTNKCTSYEAGATIDVKWKETVGHIGCFQVALSKANDQGFIVLKQINDLDNAAGAVYPDKVTLPPGVTCKDCTLVVRQLMQGTACAPDADPSASAMGTYYSCADIRIGDPTPCLSPNPPDASSPTDPDAATDEDSGLPPGEPADSGGQLADGGGSTLGPTSRPNLNGGDGGGCSVAFGATSGVSFGITAGLLALALVRRRRRRD
jgi:hypothetical protein